jgi:hypothetical protein
MHTLAARGDMLDRVLEWLHTEVLGAALDALGSAEGKMIELEG